MLRSEPGGVAFRHELARIAIEESLEPERTVLLQRRAVAALAEPAIGAPDLARLAHHAEAAGDTGAVLRFAPAAAEEASTVGAHREAAAQYARALRFAGGVAPVARAELLERFADECYFTDMRVEGVAALDEALPIHEQRGDALKQGETQALRAQDASVHRSRGAGDGGRSRRGRDARAAGARSGAGSGVRRVGGDRAAHRSTPRARSDGVAWLRRSQSASATPTRWCWPSTGSGAQSSRAATRRDARSSFAPWSWLSGPACPRRSAGFISTCCFALGRSHQWGDAGELIAAGIDWCREHGLEAWLRLHGRGAGRMRIWRRAAGMTRPRRRSRF